ncbi:proline iminopeptidase-family hydrolase [Klebsiella electrica]|jgi:L-proline amide hydrolase|uniref:Proline iminopeptidase-family hydrolase n=1 Tax=Klebsiella electrica TaxID=1259973 RepID=A0AAJ5QYN4_9ENTR|nr:proline iminopeptidase-family hydrolase [Klebsiella electrica]QDI07813.1 L-amino acid amidase [Klebsiella electrica]WBW62879.1 proline iminopeptidase-family hydrolase [Klebsiella electrica]WIO41776.1 proline iminopeptidase-family hydrolase [Klebsiella electrica]BBV75582.1 amino acid amidase [Raoultella planticola]
MYTIREGYAPFRQYQTWFRICGNIDSGLTPLVVAHGGPGCTHDYVDAFRDIALSGRAVIHYDQLGNGRSTHLPQQPADFWQPALFLDELDNLLRHLNIADNYALLGQSWGGMLGAEHAVTQPKGLKALVIANSPASMALWLQGAAELRAQLPADIQQTLLQHEAAGTLDSAEYKAASQVFYQRHVCRLDPWPPEVRRTFDAMDADPTVYHAMNGPTEFHVIGSMKAWTIIDRLPQIEVPVLLISGRYDEATPAVVQPFMDHIPDARWVIFEASSHMPHVEERELCMKTVSDFLARSTSMPPV